MGLYLLTSENECDINVLQTYKRLYKTDSKQQRAMWK